MGKLLSAKQQPHDLEDRVRERLALEWAYVNANAIAPMKRVPQDVQDALRRSVASRTKTYRYVLPTQLLSKLARPSLDCRSVQAGSGLVEPFDARSICHRVIVPFDRENNNVLGGSAEPYLNNPLRIPAIQPAARNAQKDKDGFDDLMKVLDYAQENPGHLLFLVRATLSAVRSRLAEVSVTYPVPNRVSLNQTTDALAEFLSDRTGGLRFQSVAVALFRSIGERFKLFADVVCSNINAADVSTGHAADLECIDADGQIVLAVEVKDRELALRQLQDKLPSVRQKGIRELLFVIQGSILDAESNEITETINREFTTGQNVYVVEWERFLGSCLVLFGEAGRREFLQSIGTELDRQKADIVHRRKWASLLSSI